MFFDQNNRRIYKPSEKKESKTEEKLLSKKKPRSEDGKKSTSMSDVSKLIRFDDDWEERYQRKKEENKVIL